MWSTDAHGWAISNGLQTYYPHWYYSEQRNETEHTELAAGFLLLLFFCPQIPCWITQSDSKQGQTSKPCKGKYFTIDKRHNISHNRAVALFFSLWFKQITVYSELATRQIHKASIFHAVINAMPATVYHYMCVSLSYSIGWTVLRIIWSVSDQIWSVLRIMICKNAKTGDYAELWERNVMYWCTRSLIIGLIHTRTHTHTVTTYMTSFS